MSHSWWCVGWLPHSAAPCNVSMWASTSQPWNNTKGSLRVVGRSEWRTRSKNWLKIWFTSCSSFGMSTSYSCSLGVFTATPPVGFALSAAIRELALPTDAKWRGQSVFLSSPDNLYGQCRVGQKPFEFWQLSPNQAPVSNSCRLPHRLTVWEIFVQCLKVKRRFEPILEYHYRLNMNW